MLIELFPISVVVRLATDEPAVVQFWNSVDADQVMRLRCAIWNQATAPKPLSVKSTIAGTATQFDTYAGCIAVR